MSQGDRTERHPQRRVARTILAVDGSRAALGALGSRLGQLGYMAALSDRGAEALDLVAGRGFDLVLLDMAMPGLSGLHVLRELRGARETRDLPVILFTPAGDNAAALAALAAGADDYLEKPLDLDLLAARIERTFTRAERIESLKRSNLALDARIAARAIELGEARSELAMVRADRARLIASIRSLSGEAERLSAGTSAA